MTRRMNEGGPRGAGRGWAGLVAALGLVAAVGANGAPPAPGDRAPAGGEGTRRWSFTTHTMGTNATVTLFGGDSLVAARHAFLAGRDFMRVDSLMSNWTRTSEVARINRLADSTRVVIDPEVTTVIAAALRVGAASAGAFDITVEPLVRAWGFLGGPKRVPDSTEVAAIRARMGLRFVALDSAAGAVRLTRRGVRIDLGGIAKGYAVATAARTLSAQGVRVALVDISGNMAALGAPPGKPGWVIGLRDPRGRVDDLARLTLRDEAVSTSGKYEQFVTKDGRTYGHILDPRTGWPAEGLISVTVVAPDAMIADAWSTALIAMGPQEAMRTARAQADVRALFVTPGVDRDTLWVEENLRERCSIEEKSAPFLVVKFY